MLFVNNYVSEHAKPSTIFFLSVLEVPGYVNS